ncbi:MAG TPA: sulfotransferase family protein, partial [Acidimicrobiia bacterium]|nr:sulfotransferase family protein [Acidimicrobiia bacterium]
MRDDEIGIVSGLPRCGTSMMMAMLAAGGLPLLVDNVREADEDNPRGYYEFEAVKHMKEDTSWLADAGGKVVKMVSALLTDLPGGHPYRVVFMERNMAEILASQRTMLSRQGHTVDPAGED